MNPGSLWRDFLNRREPGARWMLLLLILAAAWEFGSLLFLPAGTAGPLHYIVPGLTLTALLTCRWWSLPSTPAFPGPRWEIPPTAQRWVWVMAAAVCVLSIWPRTETMKHGFTVDELEQLESSFRSAGNKDIVAQQGASGHRLRDDEIAARFAANILHQHPYAEDPPRERMARVLPWGAGILTAGMVALLAAALGSPRAGLAAGLIFALHPLAVQWSARVADASHRMLIMGVILFCVIQALHTNRWRWWLALCAAQALYLPGSFHGILELPALLVVVTLVVGTSPLPSRLKASHCLRLMTTLALAGAVLMIPGGPVLKDHGPTIGYADQWAKLLSGVPFAGDADNPSRGASLMDMAREFKWRWPVLLIILPLTVATGFVFMIRQDWRTRIVAGVFLSGLLLFAAGYSGSAVLLLPVVIVWAGVGLMKMFPGQTRFNHAPLFLAVLYVMATGPALQRTIAVPRQPLKETLAATRAKDSTTAAFGSAFTPLLTRSTGLRSVTNATDLTALVDVAYEKVLPLFVIHSIADRTNPGYAPILADLESSGRFVLAGEFAAFDPRETIRLYRYQPREQIITVKPERK
jgi:hypothetical protein